MIRNICKYMNKKAITMNNQLSSLKIYSGYLYGLKCSRNNTSVQALTAATNNLTLAISDESNNTNNKINNNAIKSNGK